MKICIVGGVAGGASAAARARRLDEKAEIVLFERGEFISFANCGLPYHIGGTIPERSDLIVMTPEKLKARTEIDVRTHSEVTAIDREKRSLTVRTAEGEEYEESYDRLILATGASPVRPPIEGFDLDGVFQLWTIPDMDRIKERIDANASRAVVVGAGFVGLEAAENLRELGLEVHIVEMLPQVLPTMDREMTVPLARELTGQGISLHLERRVEGITKGEGKSLKVDLGEGDTIDTDLVILSIGVRPNSELAEQCGLELSERKGILVNERMQTSDEAVYAVGDAVSVKDRILGIQTQIPLAGPANRQGRIAADNVCGGESSYKGSFGTSVVKIFNLTAAAVGATERRLKEADIPYNKVITHPFNHVLYYPGAEQMSLKLLYSPEGSILGAQCVGGTGTEKRIDVIATAMHGKMTVSDLAELELAYSPPYGAAKDPVNLAGMTASNQLKGDTTLISSEELSDDAFILDVREPEEVEMAAFTDALNIPLGSLRERLEELPKDRLIVATCAVGLRGYLAERMLKANGFKAVNLIGGYKSWKSILGEYPTQPSVSSKPLPVASIEKNTQEKPMKHLNLSSLQCPGPIVQLKQEIEKVQTGESISLTAMLSFEADLKAWCRSCGHEVVADAKDGKEYTATVRRGAGACQAAAASGSNADSAAIVVFSGDLDKVMAAFIIATGLAAQGTKVDLFFTFWGLNVLRKDNPPPVAKDFLSRMFGFMMPRGARKLALSKMHMGGMGTAMMKHVMAEKNVDSLPVLITKARELGVRFIACEMAMNVMGVKQEELLDEVDEFAGVASFAGLAKESGTVLFI